MGRGAQQTMQLTNQQLASQNAVNQQLFSQGQSLENTVSTGYQNLLANPGYTQAQQTAITGQSMGALGSTYAAAAQSAANQVALTNNSAGYSDLLDSLARQQGQQASSLAQQNQLAFANQAQQNQLTALQGLAGLYGTNSSLLSSAMGIPGQLLGVDANVSKTPSFGSSFLNALGGSLAFALLTQFFVFLRWLHRRMRDAEISRIFLCDIAASHLPHIYQALQLIAEEHGIGLPDAPPVRFMELNASDGASNVLRARPGRPRPPEKSSHRP